MSLTNRNILITGGSRGIGRAIALRLAKDRPAHIAIAYCMDHQAARETVKAIEDQGVASCAFVTDVGKSEFLRRLFDEVGTSVGHLDIFVSNAARASFKPVLEISERAWQRIIDINTRAFLLGSQLAARLMADRGGRIIGISSLGSRYYIPGYAALGAAKAALETLTRYLAVELAPQGINVNTVSGGYIDTASMRLNPEYGELTKYVLGRTPAARLGQPDDIAGVVAFLCSGESDWVRGQTIVADGGFSLLL